MKVHHIGIVCEEENIKNYFIHFTSDEKYIEDYNWFNEDVHGVTSISDSLLNTIKKSVFFKSNFSIPIYFGHAI